jgi:type VI secretion system protein ImpE
MGPASVAEQALRDGDPAAALAQLQAEVRNKPADAKLRVFLFQLLSVLGQWERALNQLNTAATLDPAALAMAQTYREAIHCELLRAQVFAGKKSPMVFGEPHQWLALLIEALLQEGQGRAAEGRTLRARAFDEAEATPGAVDGKEFAWIADADSRLGPVLEAIINGRYYWVPFARLTRVNIEAPADLRDVVWMPAHFQFDNGGESVALIPTRYAGSEASDNGQILLARKTAWDEPSEGVFHGLGQRLLATDGAELSLMDVREIVLGEVPVADEGSAPSP